VNTAIIYKLLGMVLLALAGAFALCIPAGMANGETFADQSLQAFVLSIGITLVLAAFFLLLGRKGQAKLFRREALCTIGLSWLLATVVGAIPYVLIVENCDIADAIFETSSGLTTTGATAFPEFYEFPKSLLFWRSLSQWVGGLGVVVFFVAILSSLGAGAKILFSNESSGTSADFDHGRIQNGAFYLMVYYLGLSFACMLAYAVAGMDWFQAINHAMTTVATGGFSTEPMSMEQFQSPLIEWISIIFMALAGTTFVFVIRLLRGRTQGIHKNNEVTWYFVILAVSSLLLTIYLSEMSGELPDHDSIRAAIFQSVSVMTTTGYSTTNFDTWLPSAKIVLLILMVIGGCSGSTGGGIKVVRVVIATRTALRSIMQSFRPNITKPMRMGGQTLSESAIQNVIVFIMLMAIIEVISMLFISGIEPTLTFMETFSAVQATLFNIGPGFETLGPAENFHFLHSTTKIFLSLLMILGRLELYAVLVLFYPSIWKRYS
jgi:trk system potassium uptake protein TrkH